MRCSRRCRRRSRWRAIFALSISEQVTQRLAASGRSHSGIAPWLLAPKGLLWSPQHGEQLGVVAGDTPAGATLLVYYQEASGNVSFGASYLTSGEHDPILVAYKPDVPREVLFRLAGDVVVKVVRWRSARMPACESRSAE